jgi:hypothetical protein
VRAFVSSSVKPSLKYSFSRSGLMLTKGSTAIEAGRSGAGRSMECGAGGAVGTASERADRKGAGGISPRRIRSASVRTSESAGNSSCPCLNSVKISACLSAPGTSPAAARASMRF